MHFDVIIIGIGPAGLSAAVYAKRAGLSVMCLTDKYSVNSQILNTTDVCNYIGFEKISGEALYNNIFNHAVNLGVDIVYEKVVDIVDIDKEIKVVKTAKNEWYTKNVVIATGASPKNAEIENEEKFVGAGVSYCATCDGAFYKDKVVAVIGGGDVAITDAIYLSRIAKKIYVLVRKDYVRAANVLKEEVEKLANVKICYNVVVESIIGQDKLEGIRVKELGIDVESDLRVDGVFVGIGSHPNTDFVKDKLNCENGYIVAGEDCKTNVKGIYAIGDVRAKALRQVITACADGANAINSIMSEH